MNDIILWIFGIVYFILAYIFFKAVSYRCCLTHGCYQYSLKNILVALFFPISIPIIIIFSYKNNSSPKNNKKHLNNSSS